MKDELNEPGPQAAHDRDEEMAAAFRFFLERTPWAEHVAVRDVMHTGDELPWVETSRPIRDAIYEMARGRLGTVAVTDAEGRLVGCLSEDDLRRLVGDDDFPLDRAAGEHMRRDPRTIDGGEPVARAWRLMDEHGVASLFVCGAEGLLEGIVHQHDFCRWGFPEDETPPEASTERRMES